MTEKGFLLALLIILESKFYQAWNRRVLFNVHLKNKYLLANKVYRSNRPFRVRVIVTKM